MQNATRLTLFLGFFIAAILAQDCINPFLNRTDIQVRFGGSSNILNTSRVAGNLSICPFLAGQNVCVSDTGFISLQTFLEKYKRSFTERSHKNDQQRYGGIGEAMRRINVNDKEMKSLYTLGMLFNHTVLSFNASGATQPFNFTAFYDMVQKMGLPNNKTSQHDHEAHEGQPRNRGLGAQEATNKTHNESEHVWFLIEDVNKTNTTEGKKHPSRNSKNSTRVNYTSNTRGKNESQNRNLRSFQASNDTEENSSQVHSNWMDLQKNLIQAKAKCATSVMKHLYFASCMAASAGTSALNQSNSSFKISPDACSGFKSKCVDYFTYSAAAENTRAVIMNANSSFITQLYSIVTSGNDTATIFDELNSLATIVLTQMSVAGSNMTIHKSAPNLACNNTNSNASDCNYICSKVLNSTGFDEEAFNTISSTNSTSRRRLDSSTSITIDGNGANPETMIGDSDAAVVVSVSSVPDSSSGRKVFASILVAFALLLLLLSA